MIEEPNESFDVTGSDGSRRQVNAFSSDLVHRPISGRTKPAPPLYKFADNQAIARTKDGRRFAEDDNDVVYTRI